MKRIICAISILFQFFNIQAQTDSTSALVPVKIIWEIGQSDISSEDSISVMNYAKNIEVFGLGHTAQQTLLINLNYHSKNPDESCFISERLVALEEFLYSLGIFRGYVVFNISFSESYTKNIDKDIILITGVVYK